MLYSRKEKTKEMLYIYYLASSLAAQHFFARFLLLLTNILALVALAAVPLRPLAVMSVYVCTPVVVIYIYI